MMVFKKSYFLLFLLVLLSHTEAKAQVEKCEPAKASISIDINNVRAQLMNVGDMFWDIFGTRNSAYEIPKGSKKHSSFATSIWMSGIDGAGNLYTAANTYRQMGHDFWPGPLNSIGETNIETCKEWDKMFTVYGYEIVDVKTNKNISYNIQRWPSSIAPFYDSNADGIYDPSMGDYPTLDFNSNSNSNSNIPGQMAFWVFNDNGGKHTSFPNENSFKIEVHATSYAYQSNQSEIVNNSTMYKYKIFNKSNNKYFDYRVGIFSDFDLGGLQDDYMGCDLNRDIFYTYNGDNNDETGSSIGYGVAPPAIGILILNSGKNDTDEKLGIGAFIMYRNCSGPCIDYPWTDVELYRTMNGLWRDGSFIAYGTPLGVGSSNPCKFMYPENTDPEGRPRWVETATMYDRRNVISTNSKTLDPGEVTEFEFAVVWARDTPGTNLSSLEKLKLSSDTLKAAYQTNFSSFSTGINYNKQKISVYPNPANEFVYINGLLEKTEISIYTLQGKKIKTQTVFVGERIDISGLSNGVYFIKANNFTAKILKQ